MQQYKPMDGSKNYPGPGNYNPELPISGNAKKSFLGGAHGRGDFRDNGNPGPGEHDPLHPIEAPMWSIGKPPQKKRKTDDTAENLGPTTHNPIHVAHCTRSAPFSMAAKSGVGPAVDDGTELSAKLRNVAKKRKELK